MRARDWLGFGTAAALAVTASAVLTASAADDAGSVFIGIAPVRVLDTRIGAGLDGPLRSGRSTRLQVTGSVEVVQAGDAVGRAVAVPAGASGIVANVTAVAPTTVGFVSVRPGTASGAPTTSSLNMSQPGGVVANSVNVEVPTEGSAAGTIDLWFHGTSADATTHLLVDIVGYYRLGGTGARGPAGPAGPAGPVGPAGLAAPGLCSSEADVAPDATSTRAFAALTGVLGGSVVAGHQDEIEVVSTRTFAMDANGDCDTDAMVPNRLMIGKRADRATPTLLNRRAAGTSIDTAVIDIERVTDGGSQTLLEWTLSDVRVERVDSAWVGGTPVENVVLSFDRIALRHGDSGATFCWDLITNQACNA